MAMEATVRNSRVRLSANDRPNSESRVDSNQAQGTQVGQNFSRFFWFLDSHYVIKSALKAIQDESKPLDKPELENLFKKALDAEICLGTGLKNLWDQSLLGKIKYLFAKVVLKLVGHKQTMGQIFDLSLIKDVNIYDILSKSKFIHPKDSVWGKYYPVKGAPYMPILRQSMRNTISIMAPLSKNLGYHAWELLIKTDQKPSQPFIVDENGELSWDMKACMKMAEAMRGLVLEKGSEHLTFLEDNNLAHLEVAAERPLVGKITLKDEEPIYYDRSLSQTSHEPVQYAPFRTGFVVSQRYYLYKALFLPLFTYHALKEATPQNLKAQFYTEGTQFNKYREEHNAYCKALLEMLPQVEKVRDGRYDKWIQMDLEAGKFKLFPDTMPT